MIKRIPIVKIYYFQTTEIQKNILGLAPNLATCYTRLFYWHVLHYWFWSDLCCVLVALCRCVVIVYSSLLHHRYAPSYTFPIIICFSYHLFPFCSSVSYIVLFKWVRLCLYSACIIKTFHDFHEYHGYIDISNNFVG